MLFSFTYSSTTGIYTLSLHDALPISAYDLHGFTVDDIIDFTPELRAEGLKIASRYKLGPIFTPPVVSKWEGPLATLALATNQGGTNWTGGSYDPETHIAYIPSQRSLGQLGLEPGEPN